MGERKRYVCMLGYSCLPDKWLVMNGHEGGAQVVYRKTHGCSIVTIQIQYT